MLVDGKSVISWTDPGHRPLRQSLDRRQHRSPPHALDHCRLPQFPGLGPLSNRGALRSPNPFRALRGPREDFVLDLIMKYIAAQSIS